MKIGSLNILDHLKDMFPDMIPVRRRISSSFKGGSVDYSASKNFRGFIVGQHTMVRDINGKDVVSKAHIVFHGHFGFKLTDEFTLPPEFGTAKPRAIAVQEATDENGRHHQTVFF